MRTRAAVLGKPINHSLSPVLHTAAYQALALPMTYERYEVGEGELAQFIANCDQTWTGLSLTMPLKVEALAVADELDPLVELSGAANTLIFTERITAYNTDVYGVRAAITESIGTQFDQVSILGSGATARSALIALAQLAVPRVSLVARNPIAVAELQELSHRLDIELNVLPLNESSWATCDLVISTLPGGAANAVELQDLEISAPLFDVAYSPWPSQLATAWRERGVSAFSGHLMLLHQAAKQVELMTGHPAPVAAMRHALEAAL